MNTRRTSLQSVAFQNISNASLWLDKYVKGQNAEGEQSNNEEKTFKQKLIDEVAEIRTPEIYAIFFEYWKKSLIAVGAQFKNFKVDGRMIVGLGAESVLETSIALHRTYGVPFIAGSALKGLAASYAHKNLKDKEWQKDGKAHQFAFGSQDSAGFITFHDALLFPENRNPLHADIMTVHHSEYYGDKNVAPADWDSPVPIPFLSATGNYLLPISISISNADSAEKWIQFVFMILDKALQEEGIGAKTSSGYGHGKLIDLPKTKEEITMEEQEKKQQGQDKILSRLLDEIEQIKSGNREDRKKFSEIFKSVKRLNDEQKREVTGKIIVKIDELGIRDDLEKNGAVWFKEINNLGKS